MIAVAFIAFAILVVAWLLAPNGDLAEKAVAPAPAPAPAPMPSAQRVEAPAPAS